MWELRPEGPAGVAAGAAWIPCYWIWPLSFDAMVAPLSDRCGPSSGPHVQKSIPRAPSPLTLSDSLGHEILTVETFAEAS